MTHGRIQLRSRQLMLSFFDDLAEFERDFIRAHTGRKRAKAKSVKFGGLLLLLLSPHISGGRSSSGVRKALGKPISPDPMACRRQPSVGWQRPNSPSASGVDRAASQGEATQALRKTLCETHSHL